MQATTLSEKSQNEPSYSLGYQVNNQIRLSERLVLNWSNEGLHVNMKDGKAPGCLNKRVGEGDLAYARDYSDIAFGRIGNGVREYNVPIGDWS
ncbi:MAG: hypothetical protein NZ805_05445 [Armatimonadetes bacterium]|nr:hypothetical protein [Armatimonadota bacterium]MDW8028708.1 hypothetical protein [Armatimonadota bacterium]